MTQDESTEQADGQNSDKDLAGHVFSGEDIRGHSYFDYILRNADFTTAKNLNSVQFGGADLNGASFPDKYTFPGLEHAGNTVQNAKAVFFLMLLGNVLAWLTVANVSDGALIGNATRSTLPIIESEISIARFFLFAPVLLLLVHAYFVVHLQRVWEEISLLPAIFPDGKSVIRHLPNWLPVGLTRIFFENLKQRKPPLIYLQISAVAVAIWLVQPFTIVLFGARYLITRDMSGLYILVAVFFCTAMLSTCSIILTIKTLRGDFRDQVTQPSDGGQDNGRSIFTGTYALGFLFAAIPSLIFWQGTQDYQNNGDFTRGLEDSRFMQLIGYRYTAMIRETNLAHSQLDLMGRKLFEARFLDSQFSNGDFSSADLSRAYLLRSRFDDVRFDGAMLDEVYINGTSFRSTSFDMTSNDEDINNADSNQISRFSGELLNSCLDRSYWKGSIKSAVFFQNSFRNAVFQDTDIDRVFFTLSDMRGASFRKSRFDTVYFTRSNLDGALFESLRSENNGQNEITIYDSQLKGAYFRDIGAPVVIKDSSALNATFEGDISGLQFINSDLRGANFSNAENLEEVLFENVCIDANNPKFPADFNNTPEPQCENWKSSPAKDLTKPVNEDQRILASSDDEEIGSVCHSSWVAKNVVGDLEHESIVVKESECKECHDGNEPIGPPLDYLIGRKSGECDSFDENRYSESIRGMSIPWDEVTLDLYLRSPDRMIPDNRMRIVGIRDARGREKVVSMILRRSQSRQTDSGQQLDPCKTNEP